jgi:hypothetical protein
VQVVVVVGNPLDHTRGPGQPRVVADEHEPGTRPHEPAHEILGKWPIDLGRGERFPLASVLARVIDVDVEPVLKRRVTREPETRPAVPAEGPAEVADADSRRLRVGGPELLEHAEDGAHELCGAEAPPGPVR